MSNGLEGVVAAETRLSDVDGERGRLILAGWDLERLAGERSFEAAAALFLGGDEGELLAALGRGRERAFARVASVAPVADGMDALRGAVDASIEVLWRRWRSPWR